MYINIDNSLLNFNVLLNTALSGFCRGIQPNICNYSCYQLQTNGREWPCIESLSPGHASLCTMPKDQRCVTSSQLETSFVDGPWSTQHVSRCRERAAGFFPVKQKQVSSEVQKEVVHGLQTPFIIIYIVSPCVSQLALTSGKRVFYISVYQASWQTEKPTDLHFLLRYFQRGTPLDVVSKTENNYINRFIYR